MQPATVPLELLWLWVQWIGTSGDTCELAFSSACCKGLGANAKVKTKGSIMQSALQAASHWFHVPLCFYLVDERPDFMMLVSAWGLLKSSSWRHSVIVSKILLLLLILYTRKAFNMSIDKGVNLPCFVAYHRFAPRPVPTVGGCPVCAILFPECPKDKCGWRTASMGALPLGATRSLSLQLQATHCHLSS